MSTSSTQLKTQSSAQIGAKLQQLRKQHADLKLRNPRAAQPLEVAINKLIADLKAAQGAEQEAARHQATAKTVAARQAELVTKVPAQQQLTQAQPTSHSRSSEPSSEQTDPAIIVEPKTRSSEPSRATPSSSEQSERKLLCCNGQHRFYCHLIGELKVAADQFNLLLEDGTCVSAKLTQASQRQYQQKPPQGKQAYFGYPRMRDGHLTELQVRRWRAATPTKHERWLLIGVVAPDGKILVQRDATQMKRGKLRTYHFDICKAEDLELEPWQCYRFTIERNGLEITAIAAEQVEA